MDSYIPKPVREKELHAVIAQVAASRGPDQVSVLPEASEPSRSQDLAAVFDRQGLLERLDGTEELVERFIGLFLTSIDEHMEELGTALDRKDLDGVFFRSHTVGGTAANVGAGQIRALATRMEALAKSGTLDGVPALYVELQGAFDAFKSVVAVPEKG